MCFKNLLWLLMCGLFSATNSLNHSTVSTVQQILTQLLQVKGFILNCLLCFFIMFQKRSWVWPQKRNSCFQKAFKCFSWITSSMSSKRCFTISPSHRQLFKIFYDLFPQQGDFSQCNKTSSKSFTSEKYTGARYPLCWPGPLLFSVLSIHPRSLW